MQALYIVLPILLFIALLLFSRLKLILSYDGEIHLRLSYLFVRIPLYPRKKRTPKNKKKKSARSSKKKTASSEKSPQRAPAKKQKPPLKFGDIRFLLRLFRDVLSHVLDRASRHVRIVIRRLHLSIGGADDAARAAIEYGLVTQSAAYLLEYLKGTRFLKEPRPGTVDISVNFLDDEHALSIRTDVTCPLIFLIPFVVSSLIKALHARTRWARRRALAAKRLTEKTQQKKENDNG